MEMSSIWMRHENKYSYMTIERRKDTLKIPNQPSFLCYSLQLSIQRENSFLLLKMDVRLSSAQTKNSEDVVASPPLQIGGTGKSCHQCRQKKENFAATCKNLKKGKNCPIKYCHKCLLTRYGENAEEVAQLANWTCPKCRGICNCSLCQKRRGEQPTGPLYRSAKESGFKSVAEMLAMKKNLETSNPLNEGNLIKETEVFLSGELGNENFSDANVTVVCTKDDGGENFGMNLESKAIAEEILLPPGMELKEIFGIQLPPKEVGNALQILEFCRVFGKALDLKEGEAKTIFKELISEESMDEHNSSLIQFHIRLLELIVSNSKKESPSFSTKNETNSWLKHLEDLIMQSYHLNDFPVDWFQEGIRGYYKLDLCKKFKLMTLLCDEALNTQKLRSYIQDENSRHAKVVKETKLKIAAAKEKIKCLAQKLQNENAKVSSIPGEEHDAHIKIRTEVDEAHIEMLRLKSTGEKYKSGCDATRINPEFVDNNGMTFWKLQSYNDESVLLLQVF
ncbi:hypothetical protein VIGAN_11119200 [Vigna angularis var. angularis]|uniref:DDT domain-containing protein n=1 Tax=Vigna angularis var. angularis TaxID=157739 RepID=A0A0S3T9F6_PHAAN|nr:uncharacterized protein LOC108345651 isoform X3 [Vigna angularis]BAU01858.1 hypothetical protein VIGAN_11119200 [Vigna angularis var. angularis]